MLTLKDELLRTYSDIEEKKEELYSINFHDKDTYQTKRRELSILISKLKQLENRNVEEYKQREFKPVAGDGRYYKYPDKDLIDILRVGHYEIEGKDLSITYSGDDDMFSNGNDLIIANTYYAKGKIPYKLMICSPSDLTNECYKTSILTSISSNLLLNDKNKDYIKFLANFIGQYTKHPINFIYSDGLLNKIHFARICNDNIFKNIEGKKDYYGFFHDFYDNLIRNVIYIGVELKDNVSLEEIKAVYNDFVLKNYHLIEKENKIESEELITFNDHVKSKILTI